MSEDWSVDHFLSFVTNVYAIGKTNRSTNIYVNSAADRIGQALKALNESTPERFMAENVSNNEFGKSEVQGFDIEFKERNLYSDNHN